jgi:Arc/MetJ-type ribon-helix-helix transcriptional regulator
MGGGVDGPSPLRPLQGTTFPHDPHERVRLSGRDGSPGGLPPCTSSASGEAVKNITVSLPDDVYRKARMKAAERDTSVSALVRAFLEDLAGKETDFERRKRLQNELLDSIRGFRAGDRLERDRVHERRALR